jgi:hypothetical protein
VAQRHRHTLSSQMQIGPADTDRGDPHRLAAGWPRLIDNPDPGTGDAHGPHRSANRSREGSPTAETVQLTR